MEFKIGDSVEYEENNITGEEIKGKIIAIANNTTNVLTTYLVLLLSGQYIQFTSDNCKWCKLEEPVLKHRVIRESPLMLPVVLNARPCPLNIKEDFDSPFSLLVSVT